MSKMKKNPEKNKLSRFRLRSSANNSNMSFSPRPQATISSYFSSVINELDVDQKSEDLFQSQTQKKLKNIKSTTDDDEDFEQPRTQKMAKIFDMKSAKEPKPKKKQRPLKTVTTFGHHVHVPACSDTNQEHIQLALAMSKSLEELENPEIAKSESSKQFENQFVSTQEKADTIRKTLDQFGFKTGKKLNEFSKLISNQSNHIKKKFKYITPTLFLRTDEDRAKMIESNVSAIITNISIYNVNNPPQDTAKPKDCDLDSKKPISFLLRNYYDPSDILYKKSGLGLSEMPEKIFYNGTVSPSNVKPGNLLKDWNTIPGREVTPPRDKIIYSETPPNINNESSESSIKDIGSPNKNSKTSLNNLNNIESFSNNNNNNMILNVINNKTLEDNIRNCNTIITLDSSSTSSTDSSPDDCTQLTNNKNNSYQLKTNSSPPFSFNTNKSIHGNVSPDLFSDSEQSNLELNSPILINHDKNSPQKDSNSPKLLTNSPSIPISNSSDLAQKTSPSSKIKNKSKSDSSEPESISLLDISPRRRKFKSMNTSKQNVDKSDDSDRSLSLLDSVSPRRKYLLKLAKRNESKARKNIFNVEKSFASKICKDNVEHFENFCDDIDDVFNLTQSSNDSIELNENKHIEPNIKADKIEIVSKSKDMISKIQNNTITKSPKEINKSKDLNINKLCRENSDSEDDYLSVTQLLKVYSKEHTIESNVVDLTESSDEAFILRLSPENSPELDCLSSSNNKEFYNNLTLNKTAISSSGTDSSDNSPIKLDSNQITPELSSPKKTYRKRKNHLVSNKNESSVEKIQDSLNTDRNRLVSNEFCLSSPENNISYRTSEVTSREKLLSSKNETNISQRKFKDSSTDTSPAEDQDRTQRKSNKTSASNENESSPDRNKDTNLNVSRSEGKLILLDNPEKVIQNMPRISPNEFCYDKIYEDDINIMSFLGHVNRNEISQYNNSVLENQTLDDSTNNTILNKSKKSFHRSLSESVIGDKELNYFSPRSSHAPAPKLNKLNHSFYQSPVQLNSKFDLPDHYSNLSQSCESIEISDEELNYSVLKSKEMKTKDKSFKFDAKHDDLAYQPPISDEELNYSSIKHKKTTNVFDKDTEILLDEHVNTQTNIIDFNDLSTNDRHLDNLMNSTKLNTNDSIHSESLKHPRLKDLSTSVASNKSKTSLSQPHSLFDNSFNEILKQNDIFNNIESAQTAQTPESHKMQHIITPNSNVIIKTTNITPMPNYDEMDTPERNKELEKFGLKPLKRAKGVKILRHIYDATHPISQTIAEKTRESSSDDDNRIIKRRKKLSDHFGSQPSCSKSNNIIKRRSIPNSYKIDEQIEIVGDKVAASESVNDLIFERKQSSKILSCALPLHIAWHNFVSSQQDLQEKILLYEPLQVEDIYAKLKSFGYKYHIQDIIAFLDKKCITIRVSQNNRNNRKR